MLSIVDIIPPKSPDMLFMQFLKALQQVFLELRNVYYAYAVPTMLYLDFFRWPRIVACLVRRSFRRWMSSSCARRCTYATLHERQATKQMQMEVVGKRYSMDEGDDDDLFMIRTSHLQPPCCKYPSDTVKGRQRKTQATTVNAVEGRQWKWKRDGGR